MKILPSPNFEENQDPALKLHVPKGSHPGNHIVTPPTNLNFNYQKSGSDISSQTSDSLPSMVDSGDLEQDRESTNFITCPSDLDLNLEPCTEKLECMEPFADELLQLDSGKQTKGFIYADLSSQEKLNLLQKPLLQSPLSFESYSADTGKVILTEKPSTFKNVTKTKSKDQHDAVDLSPRGLQMKKTLDTLASVLRTPPTKAKTPAHQSSLDVLASVASQMSSQDLIKRIPPPHLRRPKAPEKKTNQLPILQTYTDSDNDDGSDFIVEDEKESYEDFGISKKRKRKKKKSCKGKSAEKCGYCNQTHKTYVRSKTLINTKICMACYSYEHKHGKLVPRKMRKGNHHKRKSRQRKQNYNFVIFDEAKGMWKAHCPKYGLEAGNFEDELKAAQCLNLLAQRKGIHLLNPAAGFPDEGSAHLKIDTNEDRGNDDDGQIVETPQDSQGSLDANNSMNTSQTSNTSNVSITQGSTSTQVGDVTYELPLIARLLGKVPATIKKYQKTLVDEGLNDPHLFKMCVESVQNLKDILPEASEWHIKVLHTKMRSVMDESARTKLLNKNFFSPIGSESFGFHSSSFSESETTDESESEAYIGSVKKEYPSPVGNSVLKEDGLGSQDFFPQGFSSQESWNPVSMSPNTNYNQTPVPYCTPANFTRILTPKNFSAGETSEFPPLFTPRRNVKSVFSPIVSPHNSQNLSRNQPNVNPGFNLIGSQPDSQVYSQEFQQPKMKSEGPRKKRKRRKGEGRYADMHPRKKSKKKSIYKGVHWEARDNRWRARIYDKKQKQMVSGGYHGSEDEAALAVNKLCERLCIPIKNPQLNHIKPSRRIQEKLDASKKRSEKINAKLRLKRKRLSQEFDDDEEEGNWEPGTLDTMGGVYPRTTYARKSSRRRKKVLDKHFLNFNELDRLVGLKSDVPNASDDEGPSVKKEDDEEYLPSHYF